MLKFLGNGSAFNTSLGNNSAFIEKKDSLLLIDCGESIFDRIMKYDLLNGVKTIDVLVTHFHPDHIGSLGTLIFYAYFIMKAPILLYTPQVKELEKILTAMGVDKDFYQIKGLKDNSWSVVKNLQLMIKPIGVEHDKRLSCYGYLIHCDSNENHIDDFTIYYSGDSKNIPDEIIAFLERGDINALYQDTSFAHYDDNVHLSLENLKLLVKPEFRHKVWCMHLDKTFDWEVAYGLGFKVTKNVFDLPWITSAVPIGVLNSSAYGVYKLD